MGFLAYKLNAEVQLISYKRYLECTLIQCILSIYPLYRQVAESTFFMKSPVLIMPELIEIIFGRTALYACPITC